MRSIGKSSALKFPLMGDLFAQFYRRAIIITSRLTVERRFYTPLILGKRKSAV